MSLVLKILTGLHEGAQASLSSSLVVGSSHECDIILSDETVASEHCRLTLQEDDSVVLEPLADGVVASDNTEFELSQSTQLETPCLFALGNVIVGVGDETSDWNSLPHPLASAQHDDPHAQSVAPQKVEMSHAHSLRERTSWLVYGACFFLTLLSGSVLYHWSSYSYDGGSLVSSPSLLARLNAIKRQQDAFSDIILTLTDGGVRITGSVRDTDSLASWRIHVSEAGIDNDRIFERVTITESVRESLKEGLRAHGFEVDVRDEGKGIFRLMGIVYSFENYQKALSALRADLTGITHITDQVMTLAQLKHLLEEELRNFDVAVALETKEGRLNAYGLLNEHHFSIWQQLKDNLRVGYGEFVRLTDYVRIFPNFTIHLKSVVKGPRSFVVLAHKGVVEEGSAIGEGFTLAAIESNLLRLSYEGIEYDYVYHMQ